MLKPAKKIPDWYLEYWTPSSHASALPAMTWGDCEQAIKRLGPTPALKHAARVRLHDLQRSSRALAPMEVLQGIVMIAAALGDPRQAAARFPMEPPLLTTEALPTWGFTDVEVAVSYTFTEVPRSLALLRYSQLLDCYGERRSGEEIIRTIFLTVLGLPVRHARTSTIPELQPQTAKAA